MGIPGLWDFLDATGSNKTLAELSDQVQADHGRRLRIAVDGNIWIFQNRMSKTGQSPVLRGFYHRLCRLVGLNVDAVFVFDGPHKPDFKRNKQVFKGQTRDVTLARQLLECFGVPSYMAPGEAEAECARLEQAGVVDYVVTEDVDALMFGCRKVLRGWSLGRGGSMAATGVRLIELDRVRAELRLDQSGMILVALMSGGDYIPQGIAKCGIKTAVEIAQAGYGQDLIRARFSDDQIEAWKQRLLEALRTNESGAFRSRHKAIELGPDFPSMSILGNYLHPVVSGSSYAETSEASQAHLPEETLRWGQSPDVDALAAFLGKHLGWATRRGVEKFVKTFAPAYLGWQLGTGDGANLMGVHGDRTHASTGNVHELRVSMVPLDVVAVELPEPTPEDDNEESLGPSSQEDPEELAALCDREVRIWLPRRIVAEGAPAVVDAWQRDVLDRAQKVRRKHDQRGALDNFVVHLKPSQGAQSPTKPTQSSQSSPAKKSPSKVASKLTSFTASQRDTYAMLSSSLELTDDEDFATDVRVNALMTRITKAVRSQDPTEVLEPPVQSTEDEPTQVDPPDESLGLAGSLSSTLSGTLSSFIDLSSSPVPCSYAYSGLSSNIVLSSSPAALQAVAEASPSPPSTPRQTQLTNYFSSPPRPETLGCGGAEALEAGFSGLDDLDSLDDADLEELGRAVLSQLPSSPPAPPSPRPLDLASSPPSRLAGRSTPDGLKSADGHKSGSSHKSGDRQSPTGPYGSPNGFRLAPEPQDAPTPLPLPRPKSRLRIRVSEGGCHFRPSLDSDTDYEQDAPDLAELLSLEQKLARNRGRVLAVRAFDLTDE
ncbi:uncharacterized protein V1510DRAFT_401286 [Dipodascopsis tothii]|uniref:uncharacterized protein n=1 Tax=Dipodascopsis tothii TaxID=44089 RepID=UPI0034CE5503